MGRYAIAPRAAGGRGGMGHTATPPSNVVQFPRNPAPSEARNTSGGGSNSGNVVQFPGSGDRGQGGGSNAGALTPVPKSNPPSSSRGQPGGSAISPMPGGGADNFLDRRPDVGNFTRDMNDQMLRDRGIPTPGQALDNALGNPLGNLQKDIADNWNDSMGGVKGALEDLGRGLENKLNDGLRKLDDAMNPAKPDPQSEAPAPGGLEDITRPGIPPGTIVTYKYHYFVGALDFWTGAALPPNRGPSTGSYATGTFPIGSVQYRQRTYVPSWADKGQKIFVLEYSINGGQWLGAASNYGAFCQYYTYAVPQGESDPSRSERPAQSRPPSTRPDIYTPPNDLPPGMPSPDPTPNPFAPQPAPPPLPSDAPGIGDSPKGNPGLRPGMPSPTDSPGVKPNGRPKQTPDGVPSPGHRPLRGPNREPAPVLAPSKNPSGNPDGNPGADQAPGQRPFRFPNYTPGKGTEPASPSAPSQKPEIDPRPQVEHGIHPGTIVPPNILTGTGGMTRDLTPGGLKGTSPNGWGDINDTFSPGVPAIHPLDLPGVEGSTKGRSLTRRKPQRDVETNADAEEELDLEAEEEVQPEEAPDDCEDPCIRGLQRSARQQQEADEKKEAKKISVKSFKKCGPDGPEFEDKEVSVPADEESAYRLMFETIARMEAAKCEQSCVAAVPEWWQTRVGANRPQAVIVFADVLPSGKLGRSRWSLSIPHYKLAQGQKPSIPDYAKGSSFAVLTLNDNSKIVVNASSESEAERVISALTSLIDSGYLPSPPRIHTGQRKGEGLSGKLVRAVAVNFFSQGQKDMKPDWTVPLVD